MDNSKRLRFLFNKYINQDCSPHELEELMQLLREGDAEHLLDEPLQALWQRLANDSANHSVNWDRIYASVTNTDAEWNTLRSIRRKKSHKFWFAVAAVFLLLAVSSAWWILQKRADEPLPKQISAQPIVIKQAPTNRQTIHLPDGSNVILNVNSKLNYPPAFTGHVREVYLSGEGYFDIKHNPASPFLVHSGKLTVKVLGTAFDIKAYPSDKEIQVTVTRGKVQVLNENKSIGMVTASQQISFSNLTEAVVQKTIDTAPFIAWKPSEIFFNDVSMEEAAKLVEQRFNMQVTFVNPVIKDCRISATFSEDDMPDEIMTVICAVAKANYTIKDNKITIDGKGCDK